MESDSVYFEFCLGFAFLEISGWLCLLHMVLLMYVFSDRLFAHFTVDNASKILYCVKIVHDNTVLQNVMKCTCSKAVNDWDIRCMRSDLSFSDAVIHSSQFELSYLNINLGMHFVNGFKH